VFLIARFASTTPTGNAPSIHRKETLMFAANVFILYYYVILGAVGYALTMVLLNWHQHGWAHVRQALPRYFLALPVSLVVSTVLFIACFVLGVVVFRKPG
jgi:hypothetical protein